jgi:hypothetical protein
MAIFGKLANKTIDALYRRYGGMGVSPVTTTSGKPATDWTYPPRQVVSSNVESVAYDEPSRTLEVKFLAKQGHPSVTYAYYGVSPYVFSDMLDAPSKGKFVHQHLTPKYSFRRVS